MKRKYIKKKSIEKVLKKHAVSALVHFLVDCS